MATAKILFFANSFTGKPRPSVSCCHHGALSPVTQHTSANPEFLKKPLPF
jgi:hypothetical protein